MTNPISTPQVALRNGIHQPAENESSHQSSPSDQGPSKGAERRIWLFSSVLALDLVASIVLLTPLVRWIRKATGEEDLEHFRFYADLFDLAILAFIRLFVAVLALIVSYCRAQITPEYPFELYHPNGDKKTSEELEEEALEEAFSWPWHKRNISRPSFLAEVLSVVTQLVCVVKCLIRMNVEIGSLQDKEQYHAVFWLAILWTAVLSVVEASCLDSVCQTAAVIGKYCARRRPAILRTISSTLSIPLLAHDSNVLEEADDVEQDHGNSNGDTEMRGASDISADSAYKASWTDLLLMISPDLHLLCLAFVFLLFAAISQTLIPLYLGHILDALSTTFVHNDDDSPHGSMFEVPGFIKNMKLLVLVSIAAGVFAGLRGTMRPCLFIERRRHISLRTAS
jgi:hypothetical protein